MSEDTFVSPQRERLAAAVRDLVDATLTVEDATEEQLGSAADMTEAVARHLGREPDEPCHDGSRADDRVVRTRAELAHDAHVPRSPLVGVVSPLAPPMTWTTDADGIHMRGTFPTAYQGPPGYVHGGWVALAFDELLGMANIAAGHPGMTGRLTVRYLKPTPLHRPVELHGRTERVEGRRIVSTGEMIVDGVVTAEEEGLFVTIDARLSAEYFGRELPGLPPAEARTEGAARPE